ncbi:MAG: response regulator transcription factor [Anaerolineales bacterium]|uniref:Response regulator transcription factor n=1 Tax=Candidatus Desulfolinea nitratireducens TaxID=2841698 RepID=A0A8J6TI29_9CHLR|nr:response regulator transcription factor [Candidatus Desulfolinea nitratireducens]MBL6962164.1 response regulator transcription factor [Anaerolineales bacterium]
MSNAIRVFVVDDHTLFRKGLVSLLSELEDIQVVGEASTGEEAIEIVMGIESDLILMDINMPGMSGIETLGVLRQQGVENPVLMLTISEHQEDLVEAICAGASGYLLKNTEPEILQQTIKQVIAGKSVLSPEITEQVFEMVRSRKIGVEKKLTEREIQMLHLLSSGSKTSQLAEQMSISENTVKTHIRNIFEKLEVSSRAEAVAKAVRLKLI